MCGCAVSFSLLAVFNMQMLGMPMSIGSFLIILFVALLLTIGAPGISGGGIVFDISLLSILGIPLSFIGLYAGIYRALDAGYTTVNVLGDITANILLGYKKNKKKV
jgi:Na+/H+-dicarboxylate symporter